jgi:2'-5' RNA ligase superfamily
MLRLLATPGSGRPSLLRNSAIIRFIAAPLLLAAALAGPAAASDRLVAIDVLLEPDATMVSAAEAWNARLREQAPEGFELDATHQPHITLLQQYVAEADLDVVLAAVGKVAARHDVDALRLTAIGLYHIPTGEIGLQGITIEPSRELLALQADVVEALAPYRQSGGDEAAFVPDPTGTAFDPLLFKYVESFVPAQTGEKYNPHVTTGIAPRAWLEAREAEPFKPFTFGVDGIATYQLGNFGTASRRLD